MNGQARERTTCGAILRIGFTGEVPQGGDEEVLLSVEAEGANGPLIEDGIEAVAGILTAAGGNPVLTMTGGSLELNDWGVWWGDWAGTLATFNMSGGVINFTGSPGILESGWLETDDPTPGNSVGIWNITGGVINAKGISMPTDCPDERCSGTINLWGGTINVGTAGGGMILREGALVDITEGVLVLEGDEGWRIEDYIDQGWMVANGGDGELSITFDDDAYLTTVVAIYDLLPGDYDDSGVLDEPDLNLQAVQITNPPGDPTYDLNGDDVVDVEDRKIWVNDLKNTYVGDANLDLEFNSGDMVQVFSKGKYETQQEATWGEGDFNGDQVFDSGDMVAAFVGGGYELGPKGPAAAVSAVPEPSGVVLALVGLLGLAGLTRRRGN